MQNTSNNSPRQHSRTPRPRGFIRGREWSVLNYNSLNTLNSNVYPDDPNGPLRPKDLVLAHIAQKESEKKEKAALKAEKQAIARERTRQSKERYRACKAAERAAAQRAGNAEASESVQEEQRGRPVTRVSQRSKAAGSKSRSPKRGASSKGNKDLSEAFYAEVAEIDQVAAFYGDLSQVSEEELAMFETDDVG